MRKYAGLVDNTVMAIDTIDESEYSSHASKYHLLVDIEDIIPQPEVAWVLVGNSLVPPAEATAEPLEKAVKSVSRAVEFGSSLKKEMAAIIGGKNKVLDKTEQQVIAIVSQLISIGMLLEGGAIKTAKTLITGLSGSMPEYIDEINYALNKINRFLGLS